VLILRIFCDSQRNIEKLSLQIDFLRDYPHSKPNGKMIFSLKKKKAWQLALQKVEKSKAYYRKNEALRHPSNRRAMIVGDPRGQALQGKGMQKKRTIYDYHWITWREVMISCTMDIHDFHISFNKELNGPIWIQIPWSIWLCKSGIDTQYRKNWNPNS